MKDKYQLIQHIKIYANLYRTPNKARGNIIDRTITDRLSILVDEHGNLKTKRIGESYTKNEDAGNDADSKWYEMGFLTDVNKVKDKMISEIGDKLDLNFMEVVVTRIFLFDGRVIEIFADKAIYNTTNYNTKFVGNVLVVENENKITSNNLDFIFDKNLITIYNNVKYKGYNKFLTADKIDINLLNHKVNVYMHDK